MDVVSETERLRIRRLEPRDVDALHVICGDEELMRYVGDSRPLRREDCERWIEISIRNYERQGYGNFAVDERATDRMVGYCGLVRAPSREEVEVIYTFLAEVSGRGYATEAARAVLDAGFETFGLTEIYATIDPANAPSIRIVEKLGMRFVKEEVEDGVPIRFYVKSHE